MNRSSVFAFLAITSLVGCAVNAQPDEGSTSNNESPAAKNCALVLCAAVVCEPGFVSKVAPGQCCPSCVPDHSVRKNDCSCSGGYMDATYCAQFGSPWTWKNDACVWSGKDQGGLTAEQCDAVEAKHSGDGSGSDIYNLGVSCSGGSSPVDCRTKGCATGQHCDVCRTISGPAYVCLPDGAVC
jgi:hypothetical protein